MKKYLVLTILMLLIVACGSPSETIVKTVEVRIDTHIVEVEVEVTRIVEVEVTRMYQIQVPVTVTATETPKYTPTITLIPTQTQIPTATLSPLEKSRGSGFYLVGVDIAPGVWRSTPGIDNCYWKVSTKTGGIIKNHFGMSGGTCYISASAYMVEFDDCGMWEYLGQ